MKGHMSRGELAALICKRLKAEKAALAAEFDSRDRIPSATLDDLLPAQEAKAIFERFPKPEAMMLKSSIKERKHVGFRLCDFDPLIEEIVYAFQDPRVVALVAEITRFSGLEPDAELYAGGVSLMSSGGYLRPHLDNSHHKDGQRYRALNLLYYVTPDWCEAFGGAFQLWDHGPKGPPRTIQNVFNRLVLMATNRASWHSVSEITGEVPRCCVSNYYFSAVAPDEHDYFHCTTFRSEAGARPIEDVVMRADNFARTAILRLAPGLYRNPHVYAAEDSERR
ncbi:MAG: 2OG-Fe(II) oxygenase [Caulobacteraceae bacterium]